jgi:hypothetical protein
MKRRIDPVPEWEEEPVRCDDGAGGIVWCGRFRYLGRMANGEEYEDVDVDEKNPPLDIPNAVPVCVDGTWYWDDEPGKERT